MSYQEQVCSFCELIIQIGYAKLTKEDKKKLAVHLRLAHRMKGFYIER